MHWLLPGVAAAASAAFAAAVLRQYAARGRPRFKGDLLIALGVPLAAGGACSPSWPQATSWQSAWPWGRA